MGTTQKKNDGGPDTIGITEYFIFEALKPDGDVPHAIAGDITSVSPHQHKQLGLCADILVKLKGSGKAIRLVIPAELLTRLREEIELPF